MISNINCILFATPLCLSVCLSLSPSLSDLTNSLSDADVWDDRMINKKRIIETNSFSGPKNNNHEEQVFW